MTTILFQRPPAWVTIGEGITIGGRYWRASWDRWVLAIVAVALADGLATWLIGSTLLDQRMLTQVLSGGTLDPSLMPRLLAGPLAVAIVSLVADWFLYANAVAGLRGREVTTRWALAAGLRVLLALVALSVVATMLIAVMALLGPLGLIAMVGLAPVLLYVSLRLQFWVIGVFDGLGLEAALRQSWQITRGAVLRVLGWVLALLAISILIGVAAGVVTGLLGALPGAGAVVAAVLGSLVQTAFQAFSVVVLAILYESQLHRARGQAAGPDGGYARDRVPLPPGWGEPGSSGAWPGPVDGRPGDSPGAWPGGEPGVWPGGEPGVRPGEEPGVPPGHPNGPPPPPRDPWRG